jgi:hypothetical protein
MPSPPTPLPTLGEGGRKIEFIYFTSPQNWGVRGAIGLGLSIFDALTPTPSPNFGRGEQKGRINLIFILSSINRFGKILKEYSKNIT